MTTLRFSDYREIMARFDSVGSCGHKIKAGDRIGWAKRGGQSRTECADCWGRWCRENQAADFDEMQYAGQYR